MNLEDPTWGFESTVANLDTITTQNLEDEINIVLPLSQVEKSVDSFIEEADTNSQFLASTGKDLVEDEDLYSAD